MMFVEPARRKVTAMVKVRLRRMAMVLLKALRLALRQQEFQLRRRLFVGDE
jgi:hypothetical protein